MFQARGCKTSTLKMYRNGIYSPSGFATPSCRWIFFKWGQLIPSIQGSPPTVTAKTTEECTNQCKSQSTFMCAAVNYRESTRTCELLAENIQTANVLYTLNNMDWQYYRRPPCAGKLIICIFRKS